MHELYDADGRPLDERLTLERLAAESGLPRTLLARFLRLGLIDPLEERPEPVFAAHVLPRVHRIQRLRTDLRVSLRGMGLVLELLERELARQG